MQGITCRITSSLRRHHPLRCPEDAHRIHTLHLARNDRGSFQVVLRKTQGKGVSTIALHRDHPDAVTTRVRRVGLAPVAHHNTATPDDETDGRGLLPGFVPDPLLDEAQMMLPPGETSSFWVSVQTGADTPPGHYPCVIRLTDERGETFCLTVGIQVHPLVLNPRRDFHVTHWFYADALCDRYHIKPFSRRFWNVVQPFFRNLHAHGTDVLHTPLFTPPTDGVKRPNQLLKIGRDPQGRYALDWSDVSRWVRLATACGLERFEWVHLFSQHGCERAIPVYANMDGVYDGRQLWPLDTAADSAPYREFLAQFLPEFKRFLDTEGILDRSLFHLSDEPHGEQHLANYRRARAMLRELAPWMNVMDALSEVAFADVTDTPVAAVNSAMEFLHAAIPHWVYFACVPRGRYLNRLMDTPLAKIRASGWLFYRFGARGFLHWGYNYWYKRKSTELVDPFTVSDAHAWPQWPYGDPFVVYPGPDGPIDSVRWEVFAESLNDYALLQTLDIDPHGALLQPFRSYEDFPKDAGWYEEQRAALVSREAPPGMRPSG